MAAIRILGIEHLNNRLERMHNIEAVKEAMNKSVLMVHGQAKELCPVDTEIELGRASCRERV